jgi:tetratricopeptide (TPR) repeat protein
LTDELLHVISRIEGLRVIAAGQVDPLNFHPIELGARLNAASLLESQLVPVEESVELRLRLLNSTDGTLMWSFRQTYEPDQLADSKYQVIATLSNRLSAKLRTARKFAPISGDAWESYLQARYQWSLRTPQAISAAIDLYQQVVDKQPDYADAHAGLAETYVVAPLYAGAEPKQAYERARVAAEKALSIDPENARAHVALGAYYAHHAYDWNLAEQYFARAIEIDPNNVNAHHWKADASCYRLLLEACAHHYEVAKALDPLSPLIDVLQGVPYRFAKNWVLAEQIFRDAVDRYPDYAVARYQLGLVLDAQGKYRQAISQWEQVYPQYGPALLGSSLARSHAALGNDKQAQRYISDVEQARQAGFVSPIMMAGIAAIYGTPEQSLDWLEVAQAEKDDFFSALAVIHHFYHLKNEPRFRDMIYSLGISRRRYDEYSAAEPYEYYKPSSSRL